MRRCMLAGEVVSAMRRGILMGNSLSVRFATSSFTVSSVCTPVACTPTCRRLRRNTGMEMRQYPAALQRYLMTKSSVHSYAMRI